MFTTCQVTFELATFGRALFSVCRSTSVAALNFSLYFQAVVILETFHRMPFKAGNSNIPSICND